MARRKLTNKAKAYMTEYSKTHTTRIAFQLSNEYDADILEYMKTVPNKNAYLKDLVRADMKKQKGSE